MTTRTSALVVLLPLAALLPAQTASNVREIIVVSKTHFDIGYTDRVDGVLNRYRTLMMDQALDTLEQSRSLPASRQFLWTLPGWPMKTILDGRQTAERGARIQTALREHRFAVHALPFTTHTESLDLEDLVRGLGFSSTIARSLGLPLPRAAKMTDVPSHSWVLPVLLRHAGVEFLHLGCNSGSSSPEVPPLFWWEGPDGSRLLTMYSRQYGTGLEPPADWPYRTWLALVQTGDNHGPPSAAEVRQLFDSANQKFPGIKVRMGVLEDFADAILKEQASLPVLRGDMPDTWIHGINSMPRETGLAHRARPAIFTAEALNTLLQIWTGRPPASAAIAKAYEDTLLYGEHTWGMNTRLFGPRVYGETWESAEHAGKFEKMEASWRDKGSFALEAAGLAREVIEENLGALARAVKVSGPRVVVFNPVPWKRTAVVELRAVGGSWQDAVSGKQAAASSHAGVLRLVALDLPPLGYRTYVPSKTAPPLPTSATASNTISNGLLRITLDPATASITSMVDLRTGRELAGPGFGRFMYERFSKQDVDAYTKTYTRTNRGWQVNDMGKPNLPAGVPPERILLKGARLRTERDATGIRAWLEAAPDPRLGGKISLAVELAADQPYADISWSIENKKADPWPESGWLAFPVAVTRPEFRLLRLGGVMDPQRDVVPGANQDMYCLNGGMTVVNGEGAGLGLLPLDSPLVSLGRTGSWRYSRNYVPEQPAVYWNLFNNQWSTNFQQWIGGTWSATIRVWPVRNAAEAAGLATASIEGRAGAVAAFADGPAGTLPASRDGVSVNRKDVQITAFGANPDGQGIILRLWDLSGRTSPVSVNLPADWLARRMEAVDLRGAAKDTTIRRTPGGFSIPLNGNAPATVLLTEVRR